MDGVYHVVPNGEIRVSSNSTKQWSRINLNVSVDYDTDLEKAMAVINLVGKGMVDDPVWGAFITNAPRALRVDKLGDSGIDIKVVGETRPSRQWEVAGELRLRIKKAFDKEHIEIPYPHTKIILENPSS
jgi:small conductance mechanosensitive channel